MTAVPASRGWVRLALAALLITGVVNALYYARLIALGYPLGPGHPEAYRDLQKAATWADGWMGFMMLAAALGLWLRRSWGRHFGIIGAAALIHMGILDVAFFTQHGMYGRLDAAMVEMIIVDLWALGAGSWLVWFLWAREP
jgi:hypothetical protein